MPSIETRCRRFGFVMAGFFVLVSLSCWRHQRALPWPAALTAAALFLVAAVLAPKRLEPLERRWMALARFLGHLNAVVLLTVFYYLVLTPFAVVARRFGLDPLGLAERESYWNPIETGTDLRRYEKQF